MTSSSSSSHLQFLPWLTQFDSATLCSKASKLFESTYLYAVNENQQILYWSPGMEALTGVTQARAVGHKCLLTLIIDQESNAEQTINLVLVSGETVIFKKTAQFLLDKTGGFAGGFAVLTRALESGMSPAVTKKIATKAQQSFHGILSRSPAMQDIFQIIENAAMTEATVLVRGESGSGKELVANAIHTLSARRDAPFLAINCAALSANLLESELFGHVRGAFTGAIKDHDGLFKRANGGTLFLDEVAELPLELQAKLLRVLQERNYIPVGGNKVVDVDVRIVAATHRSLREEVKNGTFREDLMYRLRVVPIFIPPLCERREDISLLIWHFIGQHNDKRVRVIEKIDPDAMKVLLDYRWPGNVRELHNVVEYAFAVGRGAVLRLTELPPEFREQRHFPGEIRKLPASPKRTLTKDDEAERIRQALQQCGGRAGEAAELLDMSRATFWRKRKQYQI